MEVSGEIMDEDLRMRMQNNIQLCEQYAVLMKDNVTIRMATLASQLSTGIFNAIRGEPFDVIILNELSQLVWKDNAANVEHASVVLAFKNVVILAESFLRIRERQAEARERVDNAPDYDGDQYSIERNPPRYLMESPKRPKNEVEEEMEPIVQEIENYESGSQFCLENHDEMEQEDAQKLQKENDDGQKKVENEDGQMENGERTNIMTDDDGRMNRENEKRTEKEDPSAVRKEKEKNEEQTPIVRSERRKRTYSTDTANVDEGQIENTFTGSQPRKRRARKTKFNEEKDEEEEEEDQLTNDDLNYRSSAKRVKSERTSLNKKILGTHGKMADQALSLAQKDGWMRKMMKSPLCKTAATFGLKKNNLECPICEGMFGIGGALVEHLRLMHNAEKHVKLFGCAKCNSWYRLPNNAMKHHREKGCNLSVRTMDEAKNHLSKTATVFGLKSDTLECPYCDEFFGCCALECHLRAVHKAARVKLFGCEKCNSWHRLPNDAMKHHRKKGCKLMIRTVDEAKKWNASHQKKDGNASEEDEQDLNEDDTEENEASRLNVMNSESIRVMSMAVTNEQKRASDKVAKEEK